MKLLIAFIHSDDTKNVVNHLQQQKISVTTLESRGGFLQRGNSTIFTAVEDKRVSEVTKILKETCKPRHEHIDTTFAAGNMENLGLPVGTEIPVGGATILILDISQVEKI